MENTVNSLRTRGYKVQVTHYRDFPYKIPGFPNAQVFDKNGKLMVQQIAKFQLLDKKEMQEALPSGGRTVVSVMKPDGVEVTATAFCSVHDSYNKKIGVKVALKKLESLL
jgi:hypothetical protein